MDKIPARKRRRLGLLLGEIEHRYSYQGILLDSACQSANELGFDLMVFMGHGASSNRTGDFSHTGIYRMAGLQLVDGLLITPPVVGLMSPTDMELFLKEMPDIPKVFVGMSLPGYPSVRVDNRAGMAELMDHLCTAHDFEHIACIRGPVDNQEAIARFEEFCKGLKRNGREAEAELVMTGNFTSADGYLMTRELRETKGKTFDALVAANDQMALGAMDYLQTQGLRVPEDVAVFGFDDIRASRDSNPPLTTVQQPLTSQMPEAIKVLLALVDQGEVQERILPTSLVLRESCGCSSESSGSVKNLLKDRLMDMLAADHTCSNRQTCRKTIQEMVNDTTPSPDELSQATEQIRGKVLDRIVQAKPDTLEGKRDEADMILQELHSAYHSSILKEVAAQYYVIGEMNLIIRRITTARTLDDLKALLDLELPRLGIDSYSLAVCSPEKSSAKTPGTLDGTGFSLGKQPCGVGDTSILLASLPEHFQILAGRTRHQHHSNTTISLPTGLECPKNTGTSPEWLASQEGVNIIILPLVTLDSWLGLAMFPLTRENAFYCYGLHDLLANILDREYRLKELVDINLKERLSRMAEEGRMRSLNSLVTGVAHEINTPIGVGITSASYLEQLLKNSGGSGQFAPQSGESWTDIQSCLRLVSSSLNKVKLLMDRFKLLAQDLDEEALVAVDIRNYLQAILGNFSISSSSRDFDIRLDCQEIPPLPIRPRTLGIVLQGVLENAVKHAYAGFPQGSIELAAFRREHELVVEVRDFGRGMASEDIARIFEPYGVMRREGGGMGIGMHIAWNLVVFKLRGKITCRSQQGQGTIFAISLPLDSKSQA